MSFSKGKESSEGGVRKLYKGVGSFFILGVNPTKTEQENIYGITLEKEPEYLSEQQTEDGKTVKTARISFIVKSDGDKHKNVDGTPIELITNHTIFLRNEPKKGSNSGKFQIVDAYGNFAWATEEEIKAGAIPQYSNGPANIHTGYRIAWSGEQELTEFLIKYMCVPSSIKWKDGKVIGWVDNLADCECRLDHIKDYFNGDFSELRNIIAMQPNNKVKLAVGVKSTSEGKQLQATYTKMVVTNATTNYAKLNAEVKTSTNIDFTGDGNKSTIGELSEYVVIPTNFSQTENNDLPFNTNNDDLPFGN